MATYTESVSYRGAQRTSTLSGDIALEYQNGRLVVRDPITGEIRTVQDVEGFKVNDQLGREMTRVDTLGLNTIDPDTGTYRGRWGIVETDKRPFGGFSRVGKDIRELLGEQ